MGSVLTVVITDVIVIGVFGSGGVLIVDDDGCCCNVAATICVGSRSGVWFKRKIVVFVGFLPPRD